MTLKVKDALGSTVELKSTGAGTSGDPLSTDHTVSAITAGASADIGAVNDAAVITDANGSLKSHVRGLVKMQAERAPASLGQKARAASLPVVLATEQEAAKAEDSAHVSGDVGTFILAVRQDASGSLVDLTGDYAPLQVDANGLLKVNVVAGGGGGGGGTQYTEDAASAGGESLTLAGAVRQDAIGSSTSTDGDYAYLKVNSVGRLWTSAMIDAALPTGANSIGQVTANAGTNLNTSTLALESGGNLATIAGALRAEDAASADGHLGMPALAVRKGTPSNSSGTDGDYEMLQVSGGRLWTSATIDASLPAGSNVIGALTANQSVNQTQWNGTAVDTNSGVKSAGTLRVVLATDQPSLTNAQPASQSGTWNVGTVTTVTTVTSITNTVTVDTELPAAAALADAASNPTAPAVGCFNLLYNGSTWDRVRGDTTNGVDVDLTPITAFDHGAKSSISTSAVQITASSIAAKRGVVVKAAAANTGKVYVGNSDVTNGSTDATDGFELSAGESVTLPVDNANKVYVIGSAASQKVFWATV